VSRVGFAVAQPAAARLWLVDAYGVGPAAVDTAQRGLDRVRELVGRAADGLPPELLHGLVGAVHRAVATRLRMRHEAELPTLADVAKRASTSIRTFYAHYESKEEAFIDAVDLAHVQSEAAMRAASRRAPDWPHAVRSGLAALCNYFAAEPPLAETVIVEVHAAGEQALRRHEESLTSLTQLLEPGYELAPDAPPIASEAIPAAIDALLYDAIRAGGGPRVRAIAPTLSYIALSPFTGPELAAQVANDLGQPRRRQP